MNAGCPVSAMNRSRRPRAPADGKSLHSATVFRNLHLHSMDMYGTFRLQRSDTLDATSSAQIRSATGFHFSSLSRCRLWYCVAEGARGYRLTSCQDRVACRDTIRTSRIRIGKAVSLARGDQG